ncbi:DUF3048 domain-containing protein [Streptomyces sp. Je 1-79]|uniref:DUF3048 domain-containing protein n=1 Tax=Streptomyces sp. Je 1-79 TaxID=2943847 RepID=UPI0021A48993|nr:DUF3048 domain-containing protein [Streptomyces sp. Je 1-79]MCT4353684.1 DUF3048 domain-containing protein [Streptomyces sp. Je 1-79]
MAAERPRTTRRRRPGAAATAFLCALTTAGLYGCTDSGTPEPTPSTTPTAPVPQGVSPFTGLPARAAPVLAVKIDNVPPARPHTGLGAADLVYVEQVEGGQTRLLAVYSGQLPDRIGPVRSARESDIELLRQFGRPALAYSGSQSALKPLLKAAPLYALPPEDAPGAYVRDRGRAAPHNLYVLPGRALAAAPEAEDAKDIGFRFGPAPEGGEPVNERTVRFPASRYTFTWNAAEKDWRVTMDGRPARTTDDGPVTASTVVVQYVDIRPSRFHDVLGSVSPYTETVGSGSAVVLRDGRAHEARWSRPAAANGTAFTAAEGEPLNFAPGRTWVVLAPRG